MSRVPAAFTIASTALHAVTLGVLPGVAAPSLIAAMWANASAESGFDPSIVGDSGASIGLFQCNTRGGLGRGHSPTALKDATYNTAVVLSEASRLWTPAAAALDCYGLAEWWCRQVERPADPDLRAWQRSEYLRRSGCPARPTGRDLMALLLKLDSLPGASGIARRG